MLRFWNHEVLREMQMVLDTIHAAVAVRLQEKAAKEAKKR